MTNMLYIKGSAPPYNPIVWATMLEAAKLGAGNVPPLAPYFSTDELLHRRHFWPRTRSNSGRNFRDLLMCGSRVINLLSVCGIIFAS